jgi:hypothetical protein
MTSIRFNADNTFNFKYFPNHNGSMCLTKYEIINATGKWKIEKDQNRWVIPMQFDTIINSLTKQIYRKGYFDNNGFEIKKNKSPYEIYIVIGDPDSWEGVTLQKK